MEKGKTQIEARGRTVDDALKSALRHLGVEREDVDVRVIDEGKQGFLGMFGSRDARIFVGLKSGLRSARGGSGREPSRERTPTKAEDGEGGKEAREVLETLLDKMGFQATVRERKNNGAVTLEIDCAEREGLLIGRRGETLQALQHLVTRIASKRSRSKLTVGIDISGYRARRADSLRGRALEMGDEVRRTGREITTEPLRASERRIIHRTLAEEDGVETVAIGDGPTKRIVISPSADGRPSPDPQGDRGRRARGDRGTRRERADRGDRRERSGRRERGGRGEGGPRRERRDARSDRRGSEDARDRRPKREDAPSDERGGQEHVVLTEEPLDLADPFKSVKGGSQEKKDTPEETGGRVGVRGRRRRPYERRL